MSRHLLALAAGLVFGLGLLLSGMANPVKVKGFLDLAGAWDPSLALVMAGAIAVGWFAFRAAARRTRSWSGEPIDLPSNRTIDARLIAGGVLFGIGWGIAGFCPGPALAALGTGIGGQAAIFVAALVAGMLLHDRLLAPR